MNCNWCGKKVRKGTKPAIMRGYYVNGTDWVGHKACRHRELSAGCDCNVCTRDIPTRRMG